MFTIAMQVANFKEEVGRFVCSCGTHLHIDSRVGVNDYAAPV